MANVRFEFQGWDVLQMWAATLNTETTNGVKDDVKDVTFETMWRIQREMPVDTSWAQRRFGVPDAGGIFEMKDEGYTYEFGSDIEPYEYIIRLNEGYSSQAPAGFIDTAVEDGEKTLTSRIENRFRD